MSRKRNVADLSDADLKGKTVFLRADLNVPLKKVRAGSGRLNRFLGMSPWM